MAEMRVKGKNTKIVAIITAILAVTVAVCAYLSRDSIAQKKEMQDNATFIIVTGDATVTVTMDDLNSLGPREITANYKKNGQAPVEQTYTGVPFAEILALKEIDTSGFTSVSFMAADGYASAIKIEEALDPEICCIVIAQAGEPLGKKEDGGSGPFMMILPKDQFSQRWCKFLMEARFGA